MPTRPPTAYYDDDAVVRRHVARNSAGLRDHERRLVETYFEDRDARVQHQQRAQPVPVRSQPNERLGLVGSIPTAKRACRIVRLPIQADRLYARRGTDLWDHAAGTAATARPDRPSVGGNVPASSRTAAAFRPAPVLRRAAAFDDRDGRGRVTGAVTVLWSTTRGNGQRSRDRVFIDRPNASVDPESGRGVRVRVFRRTSYTVECVMW